MKRKCLIKLTDTKKHWPGKFYNVELKNKNAGIRRLSLFLIIIMKTAMGYSSFSFTSTPSHPATIPCVCVLSTHVFLHLDFNFFLILYISAQEINNL